MSNGLCAQPLY